MIASAEQGDTRQRRRSIRSTPRDDVDLSRELHDHVSQTLNLLLLEMELFKADQVGREGVLRELDRMQVSIRTVLANVRGILHDIRKDTATAEDLRPALKALAERLAGAQGLAQGAVGGDASGELEVTGSEATRRLAGLLHQRIGDRALEAGAEIGERLPSEDALCRDFGVSRSRLAPAKGC